MQDNFKKYLDQVSGKCKTLLHGLTSKTALITLIGVVGMVLMVCNVTKDQNNMLYRAVWMMISCVPLIMFYRSVAKKGEFIGRRLAMFTTMLLIQMALMLGVGAVHQMDQLKEYSLLFMLPYMLTPAVAASLVSPRYGVLAALSSTLLGFPMFPDADVQVEFAAVSFLAGVVGAELAGRAHKREQILYSGVVTGLVVFVSVVVLLSLNGQVQELKWWWLCITLFMAVGSNFLLMVIVGGLMPMFEKIFNISTHASWLEWADMNHPLLRNLQMSAPGTFHHSLYVQRLAEAAAEAIGADVTRAGVCALYHDIGKLEAPQYYTENNQDQASSPHLALTPEGSARIITGHVQRGIELAREYKLNSRIIDVIREHHGVTTTYFFYRKAMDNYEEDLRKFDEGLTDTRPDEVDKSIFTYKGPIPQTRESGIVSMADAVESATRSLRHPTEDDIRNMVEGIFKGRILDGHLQDSGLTLGDIALMKESFFTTLRTMNHSRIAYPKPKEEDAVAQLSGQRKVSAPEKPAEKDAAPQAEAAK